MQPKGAQMTVGELCDLLAGFPQDAEVVVYNDYTDDEGYRAEAPEPVLEFVNDAEHPQRVALN
jgi:hypothetical protein